jgi:signal peptidase
MITHRIVAIDVDENGARRFITKGDANNVRDQAPARAENIIGRVVKVLPGMGGALRLGGG